MAYTVVGIFKDSSEVQNAIHALMDVGVDRKYIDISIPEPDKSRGDSTDENNSLSSRIGNFFKSIFADGGVAARYAAVAQRGVVMAVQTETYEQAVTAADILDLSGAVNVDNEARLLEDAMTREDRSFELREAQEFGRSANLPDESLSVEKREVTPHSIRIRSQIVDRPLGEDIRFHEEQLWVDEEGEPLP